MIAFTLIMFSVYFRILSKQKEVLPEQQWVLCYLVVLILLQNPITCALQFYETPSTNAAFGSYILEYLGVSGQFVIWLLFADNVFREYRGPFFFYIRKFLLGIIIFNVQMASRALNPAITWSRN